MEKEKEAVDMVHGRIATGAHTVLGIVVGWFSVYIAAMLGNILTVVIAIVIVIIFGYALEKFMGKKGIKWWLSNGVIIYLFIWFIAWTVFFSLGI